MLNLIRSGLLLFIDDIDAGNSHWNEEQQLQALEFILKLNRKELSKLEAADYLGISRATFDNYIKQGKLPKGHKRMGFKELSWNINDLKL